MGSSQFGELGLGNSNGKSSRKGKKNNSDKPKQPQRGLGVAQLEKIRLQSQMASYSNVPSYHQSPFINSTLNKQISPFYDLGNYYEQEEDQMKRLEMGYSSPPPPSSTVSIASSSSSLFGFHHNTMMEFGDAERIDSMSGGFHSPPMMASSSSVYQSHSFSQPAVTLPLFEQNMEVSLQNKRKHDHRRHSTGSMSQNSDSSDHTQELDLELKLSL